MKVCLTVLMGLPGSGKTTFAQTLKKYFNNYDGKYYNFIHVCYDELLPAINYQKLQDSEIKWKDLRTDVLNQIDLLLSSVKSDCVELCPKDFKAQLDISSPDTVVVVIIDDNMYLRSMRYALFRKAKQYNISFCQVYLKCSVEESNERNLSRPSEEVIPFHVISNMNGKIEVPRSTNKWEKHSLIVEASSDRYKLCTDYFNLLNMALESPECLENDDDLICKGTDMLICINNVLHQCDIAIRQIINGKIQEYISKYGSGIGLKDYSVELSTQKGKILSEIKSGAIKVPAHVLTDIWENSAREKLYLKLFMEDVFNN